MSKMKIKGIIPPVVTPFHESGEVDYQRFAQNVQKWNKDKVSGFLALGSNSETIYLTEEEKLTIIKETVQAAKKDLLIMAGTGMESTRETIALTNKAAKLGAHMALILTPFYYKGAMTSEALIRYFSDVANHSDIPILIYNVPKYTHINVSADVLEVLSHHPNIIGMKDSTGDIPQLAAFKKFLPADFNLIVGTASALFPALTLGVEAAILALANCNPRECVRIQEAYEDGDLIAAKEIYQSLIPLNTAVTGTYGIPGLKYACDLMGYQGGFVRSPMMQINEQDKKKVKHIINQTMENLVRVDSEYTRK
ncbi:dihydrodipicolinate synthase family protein [Siminovitchia terrae]|uniref:dihydrodipicolinate synthase family protein n=1 Tax=Siminovitchia terrae TaxID=1914933 RepID=UPI0028A98F65|nr:dihydrodipicolinate synthase family protein [Siminovitchia terrae]